MDIREVCLDVLEFDFPLVCAAMATVMAKIWNICLCDHFGSKLRAPVLDSWLVHPIVVGFLTVYAAAAVNSPHGRCGSCFFRWQQQNSSSKVITHISSRNRRRGFFFLTLPHPRRFDPGDSVVKQMQLSLLIAATRK